MEPKLESDEGPRPRERAHEGDSRYEPPTIRELGSLRDLVASGGNTIPDAMTLGPSQ